MIKVTNNSSHKIKVAINRWGSGGDSGFFTVNVDDSDTWDRSDKRGFVMILQRNSQSPYYVHYDSIITVTDSEVKDKGTTIHSIGNVK